MIFHEETQKGKTSSSYEWKASSNSSLHSYFIWATTQMRLLPLFLQHLLNGSYNSHMCKHQLVQETFTVSPCSSLPPWNHSLSLRTCKPTLYLLWQRIHHSSPVCLYNHIKIHSSPLDLCYIFIISSHCPCMILFWFYIHLQKWILP